MNDGWFTPSTRVAVGILLTVVSAVSYSFSLVLARVSYDHGANAPTIMVIRFVLLLCVMLVWNHLNGRTVLSRERPLWPCYLAGTTYFIGISAYLASVGYIAVSLAVLIFYSYPLLTALLDSALRRRTPAAGQVLLLLCAMAGLALALGVRFRDMAPLGLLLAAIAAGGIAANMIVSGIALRRVPLTVFSLHMSLAALVWSAVTVLSIDAWSLPGPGTPGWLYLGLSLLAFVAAFIALYTGLPLIGPVRLSMVMNLEPIATIVIALALLGESFSAQQVIGGALVIGAVISAQFARRD